MQQVTIIFFFLSIYKYLLQICINGTIKTLITISRLVVRFVRRYRWKGLLSITAIIGLIIFGSVFRCEDNNPYDIVFKTDTFQCAKEQGIEKYEIVGEVKYISGQLESLYRVRARIKFYSSSGKLIVRSYASFVEIINNTMYLGEIAHFQINTELNNVENIGTTQRVTKCEVEYLVWPERNPDTQRSNIVDARYGKEYTIKPQPNERYNLTIVRQEQEK